MSEQVSIVITTYRAYDKLAKCLQAVLEYTKYVDYKVYVWANDADERMRKTLHDAQYEDGLLFTDRIEVLYNDSNAGSFASNNNDAIKVTSGKYVLLLNDDCYPTNDEWLLSMVNVLETDERVGAVGALLLYPNQTVQHCGVFFSQRTNNLPFHLHYKQPVDKLRDYLNQYRYYQAVTGACMLLRRADYDSVGGLNERYYYAFEDIDLCLKLKALGKSCVYCPNARLVHDEGISGLFTNHPKLQDNIAVFRELNTGRYFQDELFYMSNPGHMVYRPK